MALPSSLLLVLAWDAADPALRRGGAQPAAPLPLLRALAAVRALLAVVPQLPGGGRVADLTTDDHGPETAQTPPEAAAPAPANQPEAPLEAPAEPAAEPAAQAPTEPVVAVLAAAPTAPAAPAVGVALALPVAAPAPAPPFASRMLGVVEARQAEGVAETTAHASAMATGAAPLPGAGAGAAAEPLRTGHPVALRPPPARRAGPWAAPAAPYRGSETAGAPATTAPAPAGPATAATGMGQPYVPGGIAPGRLVPAAASAATPPPVAGQAAPTPAPAAARPELPSPGGTDAFASAETGPAEAADLGAEAPEAAAPPAAAPAFFPEEEAAAEAPADVARTPDFAHRPSAAHGPAGATLAQGLAALQRPETAAAPATPAAPTPPAIAAPFALADDLHYRLIQYARFAVPLAEAQAAGFGLVYAADWPTWLAALELRYRHRCPLVLHLPALAAAETAPAAGWLPELERYALRRAHTVLVPTEALRQRVLASYPALLPARVVVCDVADAPALAAALAAVVPGG